MHENHSSQTEILEYLTKTYNVHNEQKLISTMEGKGVSEQTIRKYLADNILSLLLEFSAGIKKQQYYYEIKPSGICIPGTNLTVESMLERAVNIPGTTRRSASEYFGWLRIENELRQPRSIIYQISAPSRENGNYGFLYKFSHGNNQVISMEAFRYNEDKESLSVSQTIAQTLGISFSQKQKELGLLESPCSIISSQESYWSKQLSSLGIEGQDRFSQVIEQILKTNPYIIQLINRYTNEILFSRNQDQKLNNLLLQLFLYSESLVKSLRQRLNPETGNTKIFPLLMYGSSCLAIPGVRSRFGYLLPIYRHTEMKVTTCPHCRKEQLVGSKHCQGLKCYHCQAKVIDKQAARCIIEAGRKANGFELASLNQAETTE
jgi:hypothetical protein